MKKVEESSFLRGKILLLEMKVVSNGTIDPSMLLNALGLAMLAQLSKLASVCFGVYETNIRAQIGPSKAFGATEAAMHTITTPLLEADQQSLSILRISTDRISLSISSKAKPTFISASTYYTLGLEGRMSETVNSREVTIRFRALSHGSPFHRLLYSFGICTIPEGRDG